MKRIHTWQMIVVSKSMYKNVVETVIHNQYEDPLLNKKMLEFVKLKKIISLDLMIKYIF